MVLILYRILRPVAMVVIAWSSLTLPARAQTPSDQTPPHGGILVAASGNTLHIEAVWPMQRIVRVFVYDDQMRPLPPDRVLALSGRIDVAAQAFTLKPTTEGFLETRIPSLPLPAQMVLEIAFRQGAVAERFPLAFPGYSVDNRPFDFLLPPTPIPDTMAGLLSALRDDARDAHASVAGSASIFAYAPAIRARDHLLALDSYVPTLAPPAQPHAEAAVRAAIRAAWLLHVAADNGISPWAVRGSVDVLTEALDDVVGAFGGTSS
jgi:hypothetical protein